MSTSEAKISVETDSKSCVDRMEKGAQTPLLLLLLARVLARVLLVLETEPWNPPMVLCTCSRIFLSPDCLGCVNPFLPKWKTKSLLTETANVTLMSIGRYSSGLA